MLWLLNAKGTEGGHKCTCDGKPQIPARDASLAGGDCKRFDGNLLLAGCRQEHGVGNQQVRRGPNDDQRDLQRGDKAK